MSRSTDVPGEGAAQGAGAPRQIGRLAERSRTGRSDLDAVLDAGVVGTLSTVVDGQPWVVPMLHVRDGDRILLHGSTGSGALRHVAAGAPAALCVVHLDGLVVAHSTFDSSANYRSAVVYGVLTPITDPQEKARALDLVSEGLIPGRSAEVRPMTTKEVAATSVMQMAITDGEWLVKVRAAGAGDPGEETDAWTGVVPLRVAAGEPQAEARADGIPVPASVRAYVEARR